MRHAHTDKCTLGAHGQPTCGGCCTKLVNFGVTLGDTPILQGINLHVHCGELTAIVGLNGAGKTTLFRAMLGEIPHTGALEFLDAESIHPFRTPRIGYVPQKLEIDMRAPVSVLDLFAAAESRPLWFSRRKLREETAATLRSVEAEQLIDLTIGRLSGGELQRVLLALALTPTPNLLLLDEPVSGVDPAGLDLFYRMVSRLREEYDLSILLISHDLAGVARVANRIVFLNRGVVCEGPPGEVWRHPEFRRAFGLDAPQMGAAS